MSRSQMSILYCAVLIALSLAGTGFGAYSKPSGNEQPSQLSGKVQLDRGYTPESGIKLLLDILQRVRNSPQLALAKQSRLQVAAESASNKNNVTDYRLAIKPKELDIIDNRPQSRPAPISIASQSAPAADSVGIWERNSVSKAEGNLAYGQGRSLSTPNIWEREETSGNQLSDESRQRLANAAGKLYGLAGTLDSLNSVDSFKEQSAKSKRQSYAPDTLTRGRLVSRGDSEYSSGLREYKVALLPPNVVTGIALIRLGSSQAQAQRAMKALGAAQQSKIGNWTIWNYPAADRRSIALQVYMQHGQVEALRIFDNSLVSSDLGVQLGDSLSTVKQRFGEPAFILAESKAQLGQNYIYPISQVGFLLSRPDKDSQPQVCSLLIFNIK